MRVYFTPKQFLMLALGFSSGLPLALTGATLSAWLKDSGISIQSIGLFAAVAIPYSLKFLWSPVVDGIPLPFFCSGLGRRRGWMLAVQLSLAIAILIMASLNPATQILALALLAIFVAFLSATQDVVLDAYRIESLAPEELGPGTSVFILAYRIGCTAVSAAGALWLADRFNWHVAYVVMAAMMGVGILATLLCREPDAPVDIKRQDETAAAHFLRHNVIAPFADFIRRKGWWMIVLFIVTYKLGDAFLGIMTNPFLIEIGFTKTQIATIVKLYGLLATLLGTVIGGWLCAKFDRFKLLWIGGLLHALTNLMFLWQAHVGADTAILALGISLENFTGAISSIVFVVFISGLTHAAFTATQYALLSSLAAVGRTALSSVSGYCVAWLGWQGFFIFSVLLAFPSLFMLVRMKGILSSCEAEGLSRIS